MLGRWVVLEKDRVPSLVEVVQDVPLGGNGKARRRRLVLEDAWNSLFVVRVEGVKARPDALNLVERQSTNLWGASSGFRRHATPRSR
jgi:hypothetical protein